MLLLQRATLTALVGLLVGCSSSPASGEDELRTDCRDVPISVCHEIIAAATRFLPEEPRLVHEEIALAQFCEGEDPCREAPLDCHVRASVILTFEDEQQEVIQVAGIGGELSTEPLDGPLERQAGPIGPLVGELCVDLEPVP